MSPRDMDLQFGFVSLHFFSFCFRISLFLFHAKKPKKTPFFGSKRNENEQHFPVWWFGIENDRRSLAASQGIISFIPRI
jgi:hypothetical protein